MRKVLTLAALAAAVLLLDSGSASAGRRGGCGGGRHGGCGGRRGHHGGCGGGGCGYAGGCGGGYAHGGCGGGYGGYAYSGTGFASGYALLEAPDQTATVVVELPADATLTIDGEATPLTSARRVFQTPSFSADKAYTYEIQATVMVRGKAETVKQTVTVRGGEEKRVSLELPATSVAAR